MLSKKIIVLAGILISFVVFSSIHGTSGSILPNEIYPINKMQVFQENNYIDAGISNNRHPHNKVDQWLLNKFTQRLNTDTNSPNNSLYTSTLPSRWKGGLPSVGDVKIIVLLVDFPDYPHSPEQTVYRVISKFFGDGNPSYYPYESLRNYYKRSSYGKLNFKGSVLGWYTAKHARDYYRKLGEGYGNEELIKEVLQFYEKQHDFSQYDNDNDGYIDTIYIKWTGPDNGWGNFYWSYQTEWEKDNNFTVNNKKVHKYIWEWYNNTQHGDALDSVNVDIHETGHSLGLPDYYDYDDSLGPKGGVGGLDIMDHGQGDHNPFSKWLLGWIKPTIINSSNLNKELTLHPSGTSEDAVVIMPNTQSLPFQEFFMVQYRKRVANDIGYPTDGLLIWHVDGTLNMKGDDYRYDNSFTMHKLLRLMEADGLEEIAKGQMANAGDFYSPYRSFSFATFPNSNDYTGKITGVRVDKITKQKETMHVHFDFYYPKNN